MNVTMWILLGLTAVIFLASLLARKMEYFLNFATRLCAGALALYLTNEVMVRLAYEGQVGLNAVTLTTVGLLGIPGYFLILVTDLIGSL